MHAEMWFERLAEQTSRPIFVEGQLDGAAARVAASERPDGHSPGVRPSSGTR